MPSDSGAVRTVRTRVGEDGTRLTAFLEAWLPAALGRSLSRGALRTLVMAGAVTVDGRPWRRPGAVLRAGAQVVARVDPSRLGPPPGEREVADAFGTDRFLYRDASVLVADKPAGLPMHATADASRPNLFDLVRGLLRTEGTAEPYLGLHQRLDRETSGAVLFTLDRAANGPIARALATGEGIAKTYHALCVRPGGRLPNSWRDEGPLGPGGPLARTGFTVVRPLPDALLVEARPETGRKHQIRIQLAARGAPILGDARYGGDSTRARRVMLHAQRLAFRHPVTGQTLSVLSPYPPDFAALLAALGRSRR
ncbi:MAG: RluA family pseudouridine synthase [Vicinamibacteria bacterium]